MLRPARLLPPKRLSTPRSARRLSTTNRGLLPGAPVPTRTGLSPASLDQLAGHNMRLIVACLIIRSNSSHIMDQSCSTRQQVRTHARCGRGRMVDVSGPHPRSLRPRYPVRSERLLLRPLAVGDADALLAYRSREDVCRYVPFEPMSRDDVIERIAGPWARTELTDEGQALTLGAQVSETGELAGDVVLFWHSREHAGGELGYVFNPLLAGRGYATEAANAMLRLGFEELGLHRIVARIEERNEPSVKLARRL